MATKCPNCNAFNQTTASVCKKCGADLNVRQPIETEVKTKPPWWKRIVGKK
ncbi:MAG TPA: hypothetical protein GXZ82_14385 [Firmicutes bacterium]|jgi:predicted amidophosphoribosyltransferase|nr:hypothetical protein [Bacillota bacterium]